MNTNPETNDQEWRLGMNMIRQFLERVDEVYPSPISPVVTDDCTLVKIYSRLMNEDDARIAIYLSAEPESAGSLAKRIGRPVEDVGRATILSDSLCTRNIGIFGKGRTP